MAVMGRNFSCSPGKEVSVHICNLTQLIHTTDGSGYQYIQHVYAWLIRNCILCLVAEWGHRWQDYTVILYCIKHGCLTS